MLKVSVEFLHGTLRATSSFDTAMAGTASRDAAEWPPSPARLFSALVAADGTGGRSRVTDSTELLMVEAAPPPIIVADPEQQVLRSHVEDRYVVVDDHHEGSVQEYVGRASALVRPGVRMAPTIPRVDYIWDGLDLTGRHIRALAARAARIGYLGCADSPARVTVTEEARPINEEGRMWRPQDDGRVVLPVPFTGALGELDRAYELWLSGQQVRRSWFRTQRARYRSPDQAPSTAPRPVVLWLCLSSTVPGRMVLSVTEALRDSVLELYEAHVAGSRDEVPPVLHGHGYQTPGYQHAHWLALPHVGYRHAKGSIHGVAVWLPAQTDPTVIEGLRTALWHLRTLTRPGWFKVGIDMHTGQQRPWAANPQRWRGPARRWISAFPVVHERWQRPGPCLEEISRWCRNAGLAADPVDFRLCRVPLIQGGVTLRPHEVARKGKPARPFSHLEVTFAQPVRGPIVLGRMRQFGLGLMAPADQDS